MHTGNMHAYLCALAIVLFIGTASIVEARNVSADPTSRMNERLEAIGERLDAAHTRICVRMTERLVTPAFCVPPIDEEDETEEEHTEDEEEHEEDETEEEHEGSEETEEEHEEEQEESEEEQREEETEQDESEDETEEEQHDEEETEDEQDHEEIEDEHEQEFDEHGRVVFSEVYYFVATDKGSDPDNEWVELYNGSDTSIDLSGWKIRDNNTTRTLPDGVIIPAGGFVMVVATSATLSFWDTPESAVIVDLGARIGNGLGNTGDELYLLNAEDEQVDALSWGSFDSVFDPAIPVITAANRGASMARCPIDRDTPSADDWIQKAEPTPGSVTDACAERAQTDEETEEEEAHEGDESEEDTHEEEGSEDETTEENGTDEGDESDETTTSPSGVVFSEVYFYVGTESGSDPANEWVEIFNNTDDTVDLSGWTILDNMTARTLPEDTVLASGQFLVVIGTSTTLEYWSIPENAIIVDLGARIGNGLGNAGDELYLINTEDEIVDALSWGDNTEVFEEPIPTIPPARRGASIERCPVTVDTDFADDWIEQSTPNPGTVSEACAGIHEEAEGDETERGTEEGIEDEVDEGSDEDTTEPRDDETDNGAGNGTENGTENDEETTDEDAAGASSGLVISEVYYMVDTETRGSDPQNEWVEIYNGTDATTDLSGWLVRDNLNTRTLPDGSELASGQFMVIVATSATLGFWDIPESAVIVSLGANIGNGLGNTGDELYLLTPEEELIDALSWGNNTAVFDPAIPVITAANRGASIARCPPALDTNAVSDWVQKADPTPGFASEDCIAGDVGEEQNGSIEDGESDTGNGDGENGSDELVLSTEFAGLVVSEVYYFVATTTGSDPDNEWVELYNGTDETINLSGWTLRDNITTRPLPEGTDLASGEYLVIVATSATLGFWNIPESAVVVSLGARIGNGLGNTGDELYLRTPEGGLVDALSWGSFTTVYNPSIASVARGHSIARTDVAAENTLSADAWFENANPSPGE